MERTYATISQHCFWPNLRNNICAHVKVCNTFHLKKKQNPKYGKLPAKEAEAIPWDIILVYIICQYKIRSEVHDDPLILNTLTMIYLATGWFEMVQYNNRQDYKIENMVEQTWLCRFTCITVIRYD